MTTTTLVRLRSWEPLELVATTLTRDDEDGEVTAISESPITRTEAGDLLAAGTVFVGPHHVHMAIAYERAAEQSG